MTRYKARTCFIVFLLVGLVLFVVSGCGPADNNEDEAPTPMATSEGVTTDSGYPISEDPAQADNSYPGREIPTPEGLVSEPPNPDRNLPNASGDFAVIGGVLVREYVEQGFVPFMPARLALAPVIETTEGQPAFIAENEESPQAQLFPTGVFIFNNIPAGSYGIVVDLAFTKFPINGDDGTPLVITVQPGDAIDLGQLFVQIPGS